MTQINPSLTFPSFLHSPFGNLVTPLPCSHTPSKFCWHPHTRKSILWKGFLTSEGSKTKGYPYLNTIIPVIALSWKPMDTIRYQCPHNGLDPKVLYENTFSYFNSLLLLLLILVMSSNHPTGNFHYPCTKHIIPIRLKTNLNKLKSCLIGSSSTRHTCNPIHFLLEEVKLVV